MLVKKAKKKIVSHLVLQSDHPVDGRLYFREEITGVIRAAAGVYSLRTVLAVVSNPPGIRKEIPATEFYEIALRVLAVFN